MSERFSLPPVGIWTGALDFVPTGRMKELGAELEELGFGAIWIPEVAGRDVFVALTHLLSSTTRIVGATGIANIWGRDAVAMAGGVRALTEAFPERVLLGLGVSHQNLVEQLRGHEYRRPLAAMSTYLDAMDAAPYSAERPSTPVRRVIAALGPKMLQLAAAKADGAHPYLVPVEHTAEAREVLGPEPLLCPEQMYVLADDAATGREIARRTLAVYLGQPNYVRNLLRQGFTDEDVAGGGSDRLVDALVACGDVDRVVERVSAQLDAGADHVCVQALVDGKRAVPVQEWREVAPALRELAAKRS
ncbi:MAG TPA: LLM class F420-dependent oxidoreductase [Mycobacteriales bacterium]|nr:LLM class F420-dependent oxidoreductase [Mycobacteriales bacterium]